MHTITFTCEVITPMFLAGADGSKPELRPPSIKGILRFWWRAIHGDMTVSRLKQEEAEIFGGGGEKAKRSKVIITVGKKHPDILKNQDIDIDQHQFPGIGYLLYSVIFMQKRDCFKPSAEFSLSISSYFPEKLEEAIKAFTCLVFFGGLGSRSRRGAGSIFVKEIKSNTNELFSSIVEVFDTANINTVEQLKLHIEKQIKPFINNASAVKSYSALNGASLHVLEPSQNWKKSLEAIGKKFKKMRNNIQSDIGGTPNFGIPILHKNRNFKMIVGKTFENRNHEWKTNVFSERRASPIIIKVIKTHSQCYFPIVLNLKGNLLPQDMSIVDKGAKAWNKSGISYRELSEDNGYIQNNFLKTLASKPITL